MRAVWLAVVAMQLGLAYPVLAQDTSNSSPSAGNPIGEKLPLFARNHCETHKIPPINCSAPIRS